MLIHGRRDQGANLDTFWVRASGAARIAVGMRAAAALSPSSEGTLAALDAPASALTKGVVARVVESVRRCRPAPPSVPEPEPERARRPPPPSGPTPPLGAAHRLPSNAGSAAWTAVCPRSGSTRRELDLHCHNLARHSLSRPCWKRRSRRRPTLLLVTGKTRGPERRSSAARSAPRGRLARRLPPRRRHRRRAPPIPARGGWRSLHRLLPKALSA